MGDHEHNEQTIGCGESADQRPPPKKKLLRLTEKKKMCSA